MTHEEFMGMGYDLTKEEVEDFMNDETLKDINEACDNLEGMDNA